MNMKTKLNILLGLLIITALWTTGCRKYPRIVGNNQVASEDRGLVSFDQVKNEGTFNVIVKQGANYSAVVEAESNLIPHIRTLVNGNTLVIDTRENLKNYQPMNIYVTAPTITGITLSGSGYMLADSIYSENMSVEISGSGKIEGYIDADYSLARISGSGDIYLECYTNSLDARISGSGNLYVNGVGNDNQFTISGSGQIHGYNFEQNICNARISGSGDMFLNVEEKLNVDISGSGSIYYIGDPQMNISITGSGKVYNQ